MHLNTAVDPSDAHDGMDVKYHKDGWVTNVTNVLKSEKTSDNDLFHTPTEQTIALI